MLYTFRVIDNILVNVKSEVYPRRGQEGPEGRVEVYFYYFFNLGARRDQRHVRVALPLETDLVPMLPRARLEGWAIDRQEFFPNITLVCICIKITTTCFGQYTQPPLGNTLKNV